MAWRDCWLASLDVDSLAAADVDTVSATAGLSALPPAAADTGKRGADAATGGRGATGGGANGAATRCDASGADAPSPSFAPMDRMDSSAVSALRSAAAGDRMPDGTSAAPASPVTAARAALSAALDACSADGSSGRGGRTGSVDSDDTTCAAVTGSCLGGDFTTASRGGSGTASGSGVASALATSASRSSSSACTRGSLDTLTLSDVPLSAAPMPLVNATVARVPLPLRPCGAGGGASVARPPAPVRPCTAVLADDATSGASCTATIGGASVTVVSALTSCTTVVSDTTPSPPLTELDGDSGGGGGLNFVGLRKRPGDLDVDGDGAASHAMLWSMPDAASVGDAGSAIAPGVVASSLVTALRPV